MKCIVKDCENHTHQGLFVGDLCSPCHRYIATGEGVYSQAYRNSKRQWICLTNEEITTALEKAKLPTVFSYRMAAITAINAFMEKNGG